MKPVTVRSQVCFTASVTLSGVTAMPAGLFCSACAPSRDAAAFTGSGQSRLSS